MYSINGIEYRLKTKYSIKDWGKILKVINTSGVAANETQAILTLFEDDKITDLINLILDIDAANGNLVKEIYEEDFETVCKVINDFFSRDKSLMKNYRNYSTS